jgi:hypothetical protein
MTPMLRFLHSFFPRGFALILLALLYSALILAILITFESTEDATMLYWNG